MRQRLVKREPDYVPFRQMKAEVEIAASNAAAFSIQVTREHMLIMLHEEFGFGRDRCMRALEALQKRMTEWQENVEQEFDAETFHLNYRQRKQHRTELAWTWAEHDAKLEPLVDPAIWKPFRERYRSFGGTGAWCDV